MRKRLSIFYILIILILLAVLLLIPKPTEGEPLKKPSQTRQDAFYSDFPINPTNDTSRPKKTTGYEAVMFWIRYWADYYGYDDIKKAEAIVSCEGGFDDPAICNKQYGCRAGQGHAQFIPSTWAGLKSIGVEDVFDTSDNIQGLIYLLQRDGDRHWRPYSGHCWVPKL